MLNPEVEWALPGGVSTNPDTLRHSWNLTPAQTQQRAGMGAQRPPRAPEWPGGGLHLSNRKLLTRGVRKRRSASIVGYVGLNGSFKTETMIRDTLPSLALGRPVLSTVMILDPETGLPHDLYIPFHSWDQLIDFKDGDVLLDEVTGIMDARDQGMPKAVRRILPQMRRRNVVIRWTGIDWDNSDKRLRQITKAVAVCRGHLPNFKGIRQGTVDTLPMWAPNRLAFITTYDASTMKASDDGEQQLTQSSTKKRRAKVLNRELHWGPGSLAFRCYDTYAEVSQVTADCPRCGNRPAVVSCKCTAQQLAENLAGRRDVIGASDERVRFRDNDPLGDWQRMSASVEPADRADDAHGEEEADDDYQDHWREVHADEHSWAARRVDHPIAGGVDNL